MEVAYRREIDGLRALAVLPVIFFHAGFERFAGGFVGVDVFFVISGYLITSIILAEIKADPKLKCIPVVVLTTSRAEEDVFKAYDLHANCYITKPVDFPRFLEVVRSIENFWLTVVILPASGE